MSDFDLPKQEDWDRDMAYFRSREQEHMSTTKDVVDAYLKPAQEQMAQRMQLFIPKIWAEVLHRNLIASLDMPVIVALCVQHERKQRMQKLKRRNTLARRRRRAVMKREKQRSKSGE